MKDINELSRFGAESARAIMEANIARATAEQHGLKSPSKNGWPTPETLDELFGAPPSRPAELVEGLIFKGGKVALAAPSKARKTFFQLHLAMCVANGLPWFGRAVNRGRVLYVNAELIRYSVFRRCQALCEALEVTPSKDFVIWNLRGMNIKIEQLVKELTMRTSGGEFNLIVIDPLYKLLGGRSENDAAEMGELLNFFEVIAQDCGATLLIAHHFAKGNASLKDAMDRAAGSGVVQRDGDTLITLTPHEEDDCFTADFVVRDFATPESFVLRWNYPMFEADHSLSPEDLRKTPAAKQARPVSETEILSCVTEKPSQKDTIIENAKSKGYPANQATLAFKRALDSGTIKQWQQQRQGQKPLVLYYR